MESRELLSTIHVLKLSVHHKAAAIRPLHRSDPVPASILNNLSLPRTVSTVPANGDLNPYGVAFVPSVFPSGGLLTPGDILVSNFNNSINLQGTGTTIVKIAPNGTQLGGFRVDLDMAFVVWAKYDFCFVGMGFPEVGSLGMEANGVGSKRILESADQAKSPRRILVRSLLKSRNKLREKYRELRAECKRWRNQAAAVERSRSTWRERALAHEARAQEDQAARANLESQLRQLREQSEQREVESAELRARLAALEGAEKKG
ncbi:MAG: hypothetical protein ABSE84_08285 [Isosphaeraceae bacterium]